VKEVAITADAELDAATVATSVAGPATAAFEAAAAADSPTMVMHVENVLFPAGQPAESVREKSHEDQLVEDYQVTKRKNQLVSIRLSEKTMLVAVLN